MSEAELSSNDRPRMLLFSHACAPGRGSEGGVGWNWALQTARSFETWVITKDQDYGESIRAYLAEHGEIPGLHFVYVPMSPLQLRLRATPGCYYLGYRLWQRAAFRAAKELHARVGFDLVRQVNFMTYREPGYGWKLGPPFIWGPWGGTQNYPWRFLPLAGAWGAVKEATRGVMNALQLRFSPHVRRGAREAALLLASSASIARQFAEIHGRMPEVLPGNGIQEIAAPRPKAEADRPLRILWAGRLENIKALPLLLHALKQLPSDVRYELRIMGQGPRREAWRRLAERLGLAPHITWLPRLPFEDVPKQYLWADVFAFTSLRDTLATVLLESLAAGTPIVGLDHQGVEDLAPPQCGRLVPVLRPAQVSRDLAEAITELARDADLRHQMHLACLEHAEKFLWVRQADALAARSFQLLGRRQAQTEFDASLARAQG